MGGPAHAGSDPRKTSPTRGRTEVPMTRLQPTRVSLGLFLLDLVLQDRYLGAAGDSVRGNSSAEADPLFRHAQTMAPK